MRWLGLTFVESYVPWGVHETAEGRFDFGEDDPRKDLGAFLDLAKELGLYVFLRPGPHVNAELPYFGLPRRDRDGRAQPGALLARPRAAAARAAALLPGAVVREPQLPRRGRALVRGAGADRGQAPLARGAGRARAGRQRGGVLLPRRAVRLRLPPGRARGLRGASSRGVTDRSPRSTARTAARTSASRTCPRRAGSTRGPSGRCRRASTGCASTTQLLCDALADMRARARRRLRRPAGDAQPADGRRRACRCRSPRSAAPWISSASTTTTCAAASRASASARSSSRAARSSRSRPSSAWAPHPGSRRARSSTRCSRRCGPARTACARSTST